MAPKPFDKNDAEKLGRIVEPTGVNTLSKVQVEDYLSYLEWFEPDAKSVKTIYDDLWKDKLGLYKIFMRYVAGCYGFDTKLEEGIQIYFSIYDEKRDAENFVRDLGEEVRHYFGDE
jgi:hypothetical protein